MEKEVLLKDPKGILRAQTADYRPGDNIIVIGPDSRRYKAVLKTAKQVMRVDSVAVQMDEKNICIDRDLLKN